MGGGGRHGAHRGFQKPRSTSSSTSRSLLLQWTASFSASPTLGLGSRKPEAEQGQRIKISSKNNQAAAGLALDSDVWACRLRCSSSGLGLHFCHSSPGMSYQVTYSGTQSAETMGGSVVLSPQPSKRGALLIKGTRFIQLLQTSKDFLSQKKDPQEGHVLQPHPVSQKCLLLRFKMVS